MVKQKDLLNIEDVMDDYQISYDVKMGGFFEPDHALECVSDGYMNMSWKVNSGSEEINFVSANMFMDVLKKTEDSFCKIFSNS